LLIKVEPAGFFMFTVQMVFDVERPDPEDELVRDYLNARALEPRYQWEAENDGRKCQWLQFGGCYLGNHLQGIGQLQRQAVEVEVLTEEVARYLESVPDEIDFLSEDQLQALVATLVREFQRESTFQINGNGELSVALDRVEVAASLQRLLSG
jgi:hypothetical protein